MAGSIPERLSFVSDDVQELIEKFRSSIQALKDFNFDDSMCLSNECYFNITGLKKGNSFS